MKQTTRPLSLYTTLSTLFLTSCAQPSQQELSAAEETVPAARSTQTLPTQANTVLSQAPDPEALREGCEQLGYSAPNSHVVANAEGVFVSTKVFISDSQSPYVKNALGLFHWSQGAWQELHTTGTVPANDVFGFSTFAKGPLVFADFNQNCTVELVDPIEPENTRCVGWHESESHQILALGTDLLFASSGSQILRYKGKHFVDWRLDWSQIDEEIFDSSMSLYANGIPYMESFWTDDDAVVVANASGVFSGVQGEPLAQIHSFPKYDEPNWEPQQVTSLSATGLDDIHMLIHVDNGDGSEMRLFHYEGSSWQRIGTEMIPGSSRKLWDVEGDLYFATKTAIYRVQDEEVEVLLDTHGAANQEILSLWASKPGRIYAVIQDIQAVSEEECTQVKVLHYRDESWQPLRD